MVSSLFPAALKTIVRKNCLFFIQLMVLEWHKRGKKEIAKEIGEKSILSTMYEHYSNKKYKCLDP